MSPLDYHMIILQFYAFVRRKMHDDANLHIHTRMRGGVVRKSAKNIFFEHIKRYQIITHTLKCLNVDC